MRFALGTPALGAAQCKRSNSVKGIAFSVSPFLREVTRLARGQLQVSSDNSTTHRSLDILAYLSFRRSSCLPWRLHSCDSPSNTSYLRRFSWRSSRHCSSSRRCCSCHGKVILIRGVRASSFFVRQSNLAFTKTQIIVPSRRKQDRASKHKPVNTSTI